VQTYVSCADDGNAQACLNVSTHLRVWFLPFVSQLCSESFGKCRCLSTQQSICGAGKKGEVTALLEKRPKVFPFLLSLFSRDHFFWIPMTVRLRVSVCHSDIHDAVSTACPKAAQKNVSTVIFTCRLVAATAGRTSISFLNIEQGRIKGLLRIAEGVNAFPARCTSSSRISLWQNITRPPFLQQRAC
jgi:hypothetical protein